MRTVLPTPAPPKRPILPPRAYGASKSTIIGEPIDERGPIKAVKTLPIHADPPAYVDQSTAPEVLADNVDDAAEATRSDGDLDGRARVDDVLSTDETLARSRPSRPSRSTPTRPRTSTSRPRPRSSRPVSRLMMRPRQPGPTGIWMGAPESTTSCPRTRPSVPIVIDERGPIKAVKTLPIHADPPAYVDQSTAPEVLETEPPWALAMLLMSS
jgi:hypothetical protein